MSGRLIASADIATATGSGRTVTASAPLLDLSQTWNNAGVTFTGFKLNVTSTASAAGSLLLDLQVAGSSRFTVDKAGGLVTSSDAYFSGDLKGILNTSKLTLGASSDVILARDAANTLAQRNGLNAQTFNIYNTYTDASNYERLDVGFSAGAFRISAENAGTGAARSLTFGTANTDRWQIGGATGHFVASTDNTYDIGASGANRPRRIYAAGFVVTQSTTVAGLTAAATAGAGARSFVTDATATTFLSVVAGGGANKVPVVSDGTNWLIG